MRVKLDPFILGIIGAALFATVLPLGESYADGAQVFVKVAIAILFFLYGARLSGAEAVAGLRNWKLQMAILAMTFAAFPVIGLVGRQILGGAMDGPLIAGLLLVCMLPSTVQSSVTMTSIAKGNVAGAIVGASVSNVLGVVLTPALLGIFLGSSFTKIDPSSIVTIVSILLLPFIVGQMTRRWLSTIMARNDRYLRLYDKSAIIAVVYIAFSDGKTSGSWSRIEIPELVWVAIAVMALLALVLVGSWGLAGLIGLEHPDRIALIFCGSQKSLASGLPMASVLFARDDVALIVLPLMIYHQLQLMISSLLASRWARSH